MINSYDECHLFGILRKSLRQDLTIWHGFSNPDAGKILNWFDPAHQEYLEHVDSWQRALCAGAVEDCIPLPCFHKNAFGTYDLFHTTVDAVGAIHQVSKLVYKWHGVPRRETSMSEVKDRLHRPLPLALDEFELAGIRKCLSTLSPCDLNFAGGRFGPGATYEGFNAYEKWSRKGLIPDVPPSLYRVNARDPWTPTGINPEGITKIAEVPKTIKSNRIVSSEPAMYMYAQLGVADALVRQLHTRFADHVSLDNQERHNEALKLPESCSIDLSDASDHVSVDLVQSVLPQFWPVLAKVRSTASLFPDGEVVVLSTFAPMGSGVCFPVMTAVIAGICEYASRVIAAETGHKCWYKVYGDDIIVPIWMYDYVISLLARAGLLVNKSKSCCTLHYRESCGVELFEGTDITPVYLRDPLHTCDASKIEQACSKLADKFFPNTAETIASLSECIRFARYNKGLQRMEVNVRVTSARQKITSLDGWDGLNRWFSVNTQGKTWDDRQSPGVAREVWTKPAWRLRASWDYPYLSTWLVTRRKSRNPET